ncbi:hypothetical protein D3C80_2188720 [compost metagenome]
MALDVNLGALELPQELLHRHLDAIERFPRLLSNASTTTAKHTITQRQLLRAQV